MKLIIFLFLLLNIASAHRINIFAYIEGKKVFTESYCSDGKPVTSGIIKVYNPLSELILSGETDEQGKYSFIIPQRTDLKIVLDAGMGHRAETVVSEENMPEFAEPSDKKVKKQAKSVTMQEKKESLDREAIREIVDQVIEKRIENLIIRLKQQQKPIEFSDILGGLGYIFGLAGIILYFKNKRK